MASSDDHADDLPKFVSDYSFVDDKEAPVPFSTLPVKWSNDESTTYTGKQIFLDGRTDDGRQKIYKPVKAWKFDLTGLKPEISVLLEDNNWIKLQRARKSYEPTIRTILITVHCLHIARKNQDISAKSLWDQLARTFSLYEVRPSVNDLIDHFALIEEVVKKDERLAKSKAVWTALKKLENSGSIGDEKAVCEPSAISHTIKWQATPKLAGTVNWGTATVVGLFAGMLYGGSKEAAASASKDAEVMLKLGSTTDKREQHRLMRDAMEKRFIRITRGSIVGGVRLGAFTAAFFGLQNLLADKRGVYDVLNIVGAGSATAAGFGLIMPGSLKWRARNVMLGSVLGAAFGFPIGWAHLKLVEKANKEGLVAQSQLDEKEKATVGIGAATARIDGSLSK